MTDDENAFRLRTRTIPPDPPPCVPAPDDPVEARALEILHAFTAENPVQVPE